MAIQRIPRPLLWLIGWLAFLPVYSRAQSVGKADCLLQRAAHYAYVREATGRNDGPEIDAWNKALGIPLRSYWCGSYQAALNRDCKLPVPPGAGGSYNWFKPANKRTCYIRALRGSLDSIRPGHRVGYYYTNLGRIGHIGMVVEPTRAVRSGRPARGWKVSEGNTGAGGGRNGAGVHLLTRASSEFYAAANWSY